MKLRKENFILEVFYRIFFVLSNTKKTGTFGLGYKLTLIRNTDNAVLNKDNAINNGKIKINAMERYVPHYTISLEAQNILLKQILKKTLTEFHYPERSVFMKEKILKIFGLFNQASKKLTFLYGFM